VQLGVAGSRLGRMILLSVATGVAAGLAAKALETGVQVGVDGVIGRVVRPSAPDVLEFKGSVLLLPALGGLLAGLVVAACCRRTRAHGTAVLIEAFHRERAELPLGDALVKAAAAALLIAFGASVGKEAPIAVLGAAIGTAGAGLAGMTPRERRIFLIAGCAAGVGAVFQCPLGGAVFATTVLYREPEIEGDALMPSIIASVTSYSTFMAFGGYGHRLLTGTEALAFRGPEELAAYGGLAIVCAGVGMLFCFCLRVFGRFWSRTRLPRALSPAAAGLFCGLVACGLPQIMDPRYEFVQRALDGAFLEGSRPWLWWAVLFSLVVLAKCVATAAMMGAESAGGLFGPVVFMGGTAGAAAGAFVEAFFPGAFPETLRESLIPVGMAGVLSASLRTPLAAIVMVTEMTGSYGLIVPLMLVSVLAYILGRPWGVYAEQVNGPHESPAHAGESVVSLLENWKVREFMEAPWPHVASPGDTLPALVSRIPAVEHPTFVVLEGERPVGLVSMRDVARAIDLKHASSVIIAADLMSPPPQVVRPGDDLYGTLELFRGHGAELLPVVEEKGGRFLGVLARQEILRGLRERFSEQRSHLLREHAGLAALAREGYIETLLSELAVPPEGKVERRPPPPEAVGRTLRETGFRGRYGCHVIAVETAAEGTLAPPDPDRPLRADDVLVVIVERRAEEAVPPLDGGARTS